MPSITYWHRLEPRSRSTDLSNALAARVRDPAWFLARQWQLGEFGGEDAGTPAYLRIATTTGAIHSWSAPGASAATPLVAGASLEQPITTDPMSPNNVALAVQLGQTFDRFLVDNIANATLRAPVRSAFLAAYPIQESTTDDPQTARLRTLWEGRAIDGIALAASGVVPPAVPSAQTSAATVAVKALQAWVAANVGPISALDPSTWRPDQLDHAGRVFATAPAGGAALAFTAAPDRDSNVSWYSLDGDAAALPGGLPATTAVTTQRTIVPGHVKFRGMPNERFWDFEDARVDLSAVRPDRRSLASMLLVDFMLVHGNDWYLVPIELPVGSVTKTALEMVDVFGTHTVINRADAAGGAHPWTMFSTTKADGTLADYFVLPASAAPVSLDAPAVEDVRFLRDDTADLVWAVEHAVESPLGAPRVLANDALPAAPARPASTSPLVYRLQTSVPPNWHPFQPVQVGSGTALRRSSLLSLDGATPTVTHPQSRVLQPTAAGANPYIVRDDRVPREGVRVERRARRARGFDGSTRVWVARASGVGTGEGWSGLRFDLALPTE